MGSNSAGWRYAGSERIESSGRIKIPEGVFEMDILKQPEESTVAEAYWSFERNSGILILSNFPLTEEQYKFIGSRKVGGAADAYRVTIPAPFFPNETEGLHSAAQELPEHAQVKKNQVLHFVTRNNMIESEKRSCYVLTRSELEDLIGRQLKVKTITKSIPE